MLHLLSRITLGNTKPKLTVLNNFMKRRSRAESSDLGLTQYLIMGHWENRIVSNGVRQLFLVTYNRPLGLSDATEYHHIYFRFYVDGLDLTST